MRIVFAGTPDFAAQTLSALLKAKHDVICVYTQPDRKTGRGQKMTPPAVKKIALENDIEVRQPLSFKYDVDYSKLKSLNADVMIVVAYGMLLPQRILDLPKYGCLNIHASLLPRWRGAAPIQRAIQAGDHQTGVCIMQMEAGLDTGPVLSESRIEIGSADTSATLHDKLSELGANAILDTLKELPKQLKNAIPQNHAKACYAHKISKSEADIDWQKDALDIQRQIQAFNPWPVCHSFCDENRFRFWQAEAKIFLHNEKPGTIITMDKNSLHIACGKDLLAVGIIQRDGSKPLSILDFNNSSVLKQGQCFKSSI